MMFHPADLPPISQLKPPWLKLQKRVGRCFVIKTELPKWSKKLFYSLIRQEAYRPNLNN